MPGVGAAARFQLYKTFTNALQPFGNRARLLVHDEPMKIKNSRAVQILTIALGLSMLTTYVVYSQRERSRSVAPGSKSMAIIGTKETSAPAISLNKNHFQSGTAGMVASGSKSTVPIFDVRPITAPQVADHPIQNPAI